MGSIFCINQADLPWSEYSSDRGPTAIRYKALTAGARGVPPVQYVEYGPGQADAVHQHDVGEFFVVMTGEMWIADQRTGPGGVVFIPAHTDYAVRAGDDGAQYFRLVTG